MPLFYTHLENADGFQPDERGRTFADDQHALQEATRTAGAILSDELASEAGSVSIRMLVVRADGSAVASINVRGRVHRGAENSSFDRGGDSAG